MVIILSLSLLILLSLLSLNDFNAGEGFLLVFSLTDRNSFEEIYKFHKQVIHNHNFEFCDLCLWNLNK